MDLVVCKLCMSEYAPLKEVLCRGCNEELNRMFPEFNIDASHEFDIDIEEPKLEVELPEMDLEELLVQPSFTIIIELAPHPPSNWVGRAWEFFDSEKSAQSRLAQLMERNARATLLPFDFARDAQAAGIK